TTIPKFKTGRPALRFHLFIQKLSFREQRLDQTRHFCLEARSRKNYRVNRIE
ncbi:unnamed protein product, partial [Amoebophrya sp. A25]